MTLLPPRDPGAAPLIIERPDLQSGRMRLVYTLLTTLMWGLWTYLWLPLVSLIAWALGVRLLVIEMLLPANLDYLYDLLFYGQVALVALAVILVWSRYNIARFRGHERRRAPQPLTAADQAAYHDIDPELVARLRRARVATVEYDAMDRLIQVQAGTVTPYTITARKREDPAAIPADSPA